MDWNSPFLSIRISVFQSSRCGLGSGSWLTFVLLFHSAWYYSFLAFLWLLFSIIFFSQKLVESSIRGTEFILKQFPWNGNETLFFRCIWFLKDGWQILACCCLGGRWRAPTFSALLCCYRHFVFSNFLVRGFKSIENLMIFIIIMLILLTPSTWTSWFTHVIICLSTEMIQYNLQTKIILSHN